MTSALEAMINLDNVTVRRAGRLVLDNISVRFYPDRITAIVGPNGAGKSTILGVAAAKLLPAGGTVSRACPPEHLSYVDQDIALYPTLTVDTNIRFFTDLGGRNTSAPAQEVLSLLGIDHLRDRKVQALSGGERRLVHLAVAFAHSPKAALLDEPTVGLDASARARVRALLNEVRAAGTCVVIATHLTADIELLADYVYVVSGGRVRADGSVAELIARYGRWGTELVLDTTVDPPAGFEAGPGNRLLCYGKDAADNPDAVVAALGTLKHRLLGVQILRPNIDTAISTALDGVTPVTDHAREDRAEAEG